MPAVPSPPRKSPIPEMTGTVEIHTRLAPTRTTPKPAASSPRGARPPPKPRPMAVRPANMPTTKRLASRVASALEMPVRLATMVEPQKTNENSIETPMTRKNQAIQ